MSDELISSYIDQAAIRSQTDFLIGELARAKKAYENLSNSRVNINGSKPLVDISSNIKQAEKETQALLKTQNQLIDAKKKQVQLENELLKQAALQERAAQAALKTQNQKSKNIETVSVTNLPVAEIERTGTAVNALDLAQADAANSATAMGNANLKSKDALKQTTQSSLELNKQLELKKQLDKQAALELRNTVREENAVKGSLEQRRAALIRLNAVYDNQSPAERASAAGQRLQTIIGGLDTQVKDLESSTGRSQRNVGNYGSAFDKVKEGAGKAFSALRTLANIIPGLGLSGIFLLGYEAIKAFAGAVTGIEKPLFGFKEMVKTIAEVNVQAADSAGKEAGQLKILRAEIESTNVPMKTRLQAIKNIKEEYPEYFKGLSTEDLLAGKVGDAYNKAADAIIRKARANAAAAEIEKLSSQQLAIEFKIQAAEAKAAKESADARDQSITRGGTGDAAGTQRINSADAQRAGIQIRLNLEKKAAEEEKKIAQDKIDFLTKFALQGATETTNFNNNQKAKSKEAVDYEFELLKLELQQRIDFNKAIVDDTESSLEARLIALLEYTNLREKLIKAQEEQDKKGKNAGEIKVIEQKTYNDLLKIYEEFSNKKYALLKESDDKIIMETKVVSGDIKAATQKASDDLAKLDKEAKDKLIKNEEDYARRKKEIYNELGKAIQSAIVSFYEGQIDQQKNSLQAQSDEIDKRKNQELAANDAVVQSAQDKAANVAIIEARAQSQKEAIDKKQRALDVQKAQFERVIAIADVVQNVARAVAKDLLINKSLIPLDIAIGAAQIAAIVARPIPRFKSGKGKGNSYEGLAVVGDGGKQEVIQRSDGSIELTPAKDTLTHIGKDDIVHPSKDAWLNAILGAANRDAMGGMVLPNTKKEDKVGSALALQTKLLQQIANKKEVTIGASDKGMIALHQWGARQIKYVNENTQF